MEDFNITKIMSNLLKKHPDPELGQEGGFQNPQLSIILPCRNEEKALHYCLNQIKQVLKQNNLTAEIIISDSSTDKSYEIAKQFANNNQNLKIKLIKHNKQGYGNAYLEAFPYVTTSYIFMVDCDGSYDFNEIPNFLNELGQVGKSKIIQNKLQEDCDFVIGNRFAYKLSPNTMPFFHKYIGNPVLSFLLRLFYKTRIKDCHCGMRAIKTESLKKLNLQTTGMEFASEMIIKALKNNLKIKQLPIHYKKRIGESKLNSLRDAWRHLRFMLLYSPLFLFFIPGIILFSLGIITLLIFYFTNPSILGFTFYIHPMFLSSLLVIIGYQLIIFSIFAKTYAITHLNEKSPLEKLYKHITIEKAGIIGIIIFFLGAAIYLFILIKWINSNFSSLNEIKNMILGLTVAIIGIQTIFSSFMLSILGIKEK